MSDRRLDAATVRRWAQTAVAELVGHTDEINGLNVFPVADADTGTNMLFTMRAAWAGVDDAVEGVAAVTAALADGALHGARGNSGVILSQILRGLADVSAAAAGGDGTAGQPVDEIDGPLFAAALRHALVLVVASVGEVVAGTVVSVLADAAQAAEDAAADRAAPDEIADVVAAAAQAAAEALDRTTGQLDVLARAGVVDAGGRGLLVLLDALSATLTGYAPRRPAFAAMSPPPVPAPDTPRFEIMYLLSGCEADGVEALRARLDDLGDSVVIAASGGGAGSAASGGGAGSAASGSGAGSAASGSGANAVDAPRFSVHVHADDAGAAVEAGLAAGALSQIQITPLRGGGRHRTATGGPADRAVLAVVDGEGAEALFGGEGAHTLRPEHGVPVSAQQLLQALVATGAAQVMVLPNGYVAAEELLAGRAVASDWGLTTVPVPSASMVQGLAALAVHDPQRRLVDDGFTMARAAADARYGSVRVAAEEALTWAGTCQPGDGLGIAGDEVVIVGDDVVNAGTGLIDVLLAAGGELVTVLTGVAVDTGVGEALAAHVRRAHPGTELVTYHTGHRGDALLIGVE